MKHLRRFDESVDHNKINSFIQRANSIINSSEEFEQGDEPSRVDMLSELGDLYNDLEMTREELEMAINSKRVSDVDGLLKIILDEVINEKPDSIVRNQNTPMEKVVVYYACMNGGDGSVSLEWYLTEDEAEYAEYGQDQGWGESCVGSVETFIGSDIHREAKRNSR